MRRVALISGLTLAVLAGLVLLAAAAGLVWVSRGDLAPQLSRLAASQLGRDVSADSITFRPGFPAKLEIRNLRVANADWARARGSDDAMLRLERLSAEIDLTALPGGLLRYGKLEASGLRVTLERDADRTGNWRFDGLGDAAPSGGLALVPANRSQFPELRDFALSDAEIRYRTSSGQWLRIGLRDALIRARDGDAPVLLQITGSYNDAPLALEGRTAPVSVLRDATKPFEAAFTITGDNLRADFGGLIDRPLDFDAVQGRLSLEAGLLSSLLRLFGAEMALPVPLTVVGGLSRDGDAWRLDDLHGAIGGQDVSGMLALTEGTAGAGDAIEAKLQMPELTLDPLLAALPDSGEPSLQLDADPAAARIALELDTKKLLYRNWRLADLSTALHTEPGRLELQRLSAAFAGGRLQASGSARAEKGITHLRARGHLAGADAARLATALGAAEEPIAGRLTAGAFVEMQGRNWAEALRVSRGHLVTVMQDGRIDRALLEQASTDLRALFRHRDGRAPLDCLLAVGTLQNGEVALTPLRLHAPGAQLSGGGIVDLIGRRLDVVLRSDTKASGFFALDVPLRFQGSFDAIRVRPTTAQATLPALDAQIAVDALPPALQQLAGGNACFG